MASCAPLAAASTTLVQSDLKYRENKWVLLLVVRKVFLSSTCVWQTTFTDSLLTFQIGDCCNIATFTDYLLTFQIGDC